MSGVRIVIGVVFLLAGASVLYGAIIKYKMLTFFGFVMLLLAVLCLGTIGLCLVK